MTVIYTRGLTKQFGEDYAVQDLDLQIPPSSIFGFIGPSGCGKTTTVRLLLGIYEPTAGEVSVLGQTPQKFTSRQRERLGYMPQSFVLYPDLSVQENLQVAGDLYGMPFRRGERIDTMLELVELQDHRGKLARNLSGGMRRRLSLAAALLHQPELIFLDEPTAGIDPVLRRKFWDYFTRLKEQERSLFITTQYVGEAAYCDYVGVMAEGRLVVLDTPEGLRRKAYGGEILHIQTEELLAPGHFFELRRAPFSKNGRVHSLPDRTVQILVEDAGEALPEVLGWFQEKEIVVTSATEFNPPFDDVFVHLIEEANREH